MVVVSLAKARKTLFPPDPKQNCIIVLTDCLHVDNRCHVTFNLKSSTIVTAMYGPLERMTHFKDILLVTCSILACCQFVAILSTATDCSELNICRFCSCRDMVSLQ